MRIMLAVLVIACSTNVLSQQALDPQSSRAELLSDLRSGDAQVRMDAFDKLRNDPSALRDPAVKASLINLLDRENKEPIFGEEEDYAAYTSWLSDTVAKLIDWSDPHEVCVVANSSDLPDALADHAKTAVHCLLQRLKGASATTRGITVAMLVQAVDKGKSSLDADTIQLVHQTVLIALQDSNQNVKVPTIEALKQYGGQDAIPALRVVAEKDPDPSEHYAIRKSASEAIATIQKRASQNHTKSADQQ